MFAGDSTETIARDLHMKSTGVAAQVAGTDWAEPARSLGRALPGSSFDENVSTLNETVSHALENFVTGAHHRVQDRYFFPGQILVVLVFDAAANHCFDPFGKNQVAKGICRWLRQNQCPFFEYSALLVDDSDKNFGGQIKSGRYISRPIGV